MIGAAAVRAAVEEIDISTDPDLEARYGLEIPVLLVDGKKAAKYRVTEGELTRMLLDDGLDRQEGLDRLDGCARPILPLLPVPPFLPTSR